MSLPRWLHRLSVAFWLCSTCLFADPSGDSAPGFTEYSWKPVPGSAYYQGTFAPPANSATKAPGQKIHFRTSSESVLLPSDSNVELGAYGTKGRVITPAKKMEVTSRKPEVPAPAEQPSEKLPQEPPPDDAIVSTPPGELETLEEAAVEQERESQKARAGASIGIGRERISSKGGASEFSGSTLVNTTKVTLLTPLPGSQPLFLNFEFEGHIFATKQKTEGGTSGESETVKEFTRLAGVGSARTDLMPMFDRTSQKSRLFGELGFEFMQMPSLEVGDVETSAADLHSASGFGPVLGMHYLHLLPEDSSEIGIGFRILPYMTGLVESGSAVKINADWRYNFAPAFYSEIGLVNRRDSITVAAGCNGEATCRNKSTALSTITTVELGFGSRF